MKLNQLTAQRINQLLEEQHLTKYALSKRSAVPCSTLSTLLSCKTGKTTDETILNICRGFNIRLTDFYNSKLFEPENISDD